MNDNRILFVDLDGTLIKEDLSNLAFYNCLKKNPFKLILLKRKNFRELYSPDWEIKF